MRNFDKLLAVKVDSMSSYLGYSHIMSELYCNPNVWELYTHLKKTNKCHGTQKNGTKCRFNDLRNAKCDLDYNLNVLRQRSDSDRNYFKSLCVTNGGGGEGWGESYCELSEEEEIDMLEVRFLYVIIKMHVN